MGGACCFHLKQYGVVESYHSNFPNPLMAHRAHSHNRALRDILHSCSECESDQRLRLETLSYGTKHNVGYAGMDVDLKVSGRRLLQVVLDANGIPLWYPGRPTGICTSRGHLCSDIVKGKPYHVLNSACETSRSKVFSDEWMSRKGTVSHEIFDADTA